MSEEQHEILDKTVVYDGFFRLVRYRVNHRRYDGNWTGPILREVFERGHAAAVLPYDPVQNQVLLIEQFRTAAIGSAVGPRLIEVIAGVIGQGETAEQVARREAKEEAGLDLADLVPIYQVFASPGGSSERVSLFCARFDSRNAGGIHGLAEEQEDIRALIMSADQAGVELGRTIVTAPAAMCIQWLLLKRAWLRAHWGVSGEG